MLFTLPLLRLVLPGSVSGLCCRMAFGPASSSDAWSLLPQTDIETGFSRPHSIYYPWSTDILQSFLHKYINFTRYNNTDHCFSKPDTKALIVLITGVYNFN